MFTLTADIWTKKNLSASFLGVACCFYDRNTGSPQHALLNLHTIKHPHTGRMIVDKIEEIIETWHIDKMKVLLIITDNGSNMQKAIKELRVQDELEIDCVSSVTMTKTNLSSKRMKRRRQEDIMSLR